MYGLASGKRFIAHLLLNKRIDHDVCVVPTQVLPGISSMCTHVR